MSSGRGHGCMFARRTVDWNVIYNVTCNYSQHIRFVFCGSATSTYVYVADQLSSLWPQYKTPESSPFTDLSGIETYCQTRSLASFKTFKMLSCSVGPVRPISMITDRNADRAELEIVDMGVHPPTDRPEGKYFFGAASYFESVIPSSQLT
jgi:hypothetical protein